MLKPGTVAALVGLTLLVTGTVAPADGTGLEDVRRLQQQRDQQQLELQLRMHQQQHRAVQPAPGADVQRRQYELHQQQRLRALHERQSRAAAVAPPPVAGPGDATEQAPREVEMLRAQRERMELMQRRD